MRVFAKRHRVALLVQAAACVLYVFYVEWLQRQVLQTIGTQVLPHAGFRYWVSLALLGFGLICFTRWRWLFLALGATLVFLITCADQIYFSYFDTLPTVRSYIPPTQTLVVWESVVNLLHLHYLVPLAGIVALWVFAIRALRSDLLKQRSTGFFIWGKVCGVVLALTAGMLHIVAVLTPVEEVTHHVGRYPLVLPEQHWGSQYSNLDYARVQGVMDYHLHDISLAIAERKPKVALTELEHKQFEAVLARQREADGQGPLFGIAKGYNLIILQLEAVQYWVKDAVYEGTEVTPYLNRLYREQPHWDHIYDITFIGRTSDAEFALNTGMMPDMETASAFKYTNKDLFVFPRALKQQGYATLSFHGFIKDFWNRTNTHPMYGIDTMMFQEEYPNMSKIGLGIPDKELYPKVAEHLAGVNQPFMAYVISLTPSTRFRRSLKACSPSCRRSRDWKSIRVT